MSPAIIPMKPGEKPTEPGWFVMQRPNGNRDIFWVLEIYDRGFRMAGGMYPYDDADAAHCDWSIGTFIAQIFPERIGQ